MTVTAVLTRIAEIQAGITGVRRAHAFPPDAVADAYTFVNLFDEAEDARIEYQAGGAERHAYSVTMLLMLTRQDLAEATTRAIPFIDATRAAFRQNVMLGGLVTGAYITSHRVGAIQYGGMEWLAVRFVLRVTVVEAGDPAPGT